MNKKYTADLGVQAFMIVSALAEWLGVQLNGNTAVPVWVLSAVKCIDYILTPMAGGAIVAQMKLKNRIFKVIKIVLGCNAVCLFKGKANQTA